MKKILLIFLLLLAPYTLPFALAQQQRGKFKPEEFKAKLEGYVTAQVGFTSAEAQAFFPIYFEKQTCYF